MKFRRSGDDRAARSTHSGREAAANDEHLGPQTSSTKPAQLSTSPPFDVSGAIVLETVAVPVDEDFANSEIDTNAQSREGWSSRKPIVIGTPTPEFEARAIGQSFRTTPYRPDTVMDGWSAGSYTIRAASTRGHLHRYNGAPRQDDFALHHVSQKDRLIVAVADGVSGSKQSHIGATAVVRYATQWLTEMAPEDLATTNWKTLIESAAWTLIEQSRALLAPEEVDAARAEATMATTLTCAICQPDANGTISVWLVGVGDSGVWIFEDGVYEQILGLKGSHDSGISSSAVSGLPRVPLEVGAYNIVLQPGMVLLVGSDGFGDPLGGGTGQVGELFASVLGQTAPSLTEFAHVLDFSRETFDDDRTLVAIWPKSST